MSADQKTLLADLLSEYLKNMPADVERERRDAIDEAGIDNIYFAWWGDPDRDQRHYYRVQGADLPHRIQQHPEQRQPRALDVARHAGDLVCRSASKAECEVGLERRDERRHG